METIKFALKTLIVTGAVTAAVIISVSGMIVTLHDYWDADDEYHKRWNEWPEDEKNDKLN